MRINVDGTRQIVKACRLCGVRRLLHVSSVAAVGIPEDSQPANEEFPFNLERSGLTYHLSKRQAENEVRAGVAQGLDAVIVNPSSLFGPYRSAYRGGEMIWKTRRPWVTPYFVGGLCVVHVEDVVMGIVAALKKGRTGERYILGGENLTFRAAAERATAAMHLHRLAVPVPPLLTRLLAAVSEPWSRWRNRRPRFTHMISYCSQRYMFYDSSKARRELGYEPRNFDAILQECLRLKAC
jgi:dihydroflavonol-4-reductase